MGNSRVFHQLGILVMLLHNIVGYTEIGVLGPLKERGGYGIDVD